MLLAYMHCPGAQSNFPELCLLADKPDQFSVPARVDTLRVTDAAVYRAGPEEALTVEKDPEDGGLILAPFYPAKLFLTPDLPQYPGFHVKKAKIFVSRDGQYRVFYIQDKDSQNTWREWCPMRDKRSTQGVRL